MRRMMTVLCALALTVALSGFARGEVKVGQAAPAFSLQDQAGKVISLADYKGKIVVLEWFNNECPFVVKHYKLGSMNALASKYTDKGVVWLAINSTKGKTNADNAAIAESWSIKRPILNDAEGTTGRAYGATRTPHMFVINAEGNVVYMGAIDSDTTSDPSKVEGATNYVAAALDELLEGKAVSKPETKPYGCTVKYAK